MRADIRGLRFDSRYFERRVYTAIYGQLSKIYGLQSVEERKTELKSKTAYLRALTCVTLATAQDYVTASRLRKKMSEELANELLVGNLVWAAACMRNELVMTGLDPSTKISSSTTTNRSGSSRRLTIPRRMDVCAWCGPEEKVIVSFRLRLANTLLLR